MGKKIKSISFIGSIILWAASCLSVSGYGEPPAITDDLNNFDPTYPLGIYIIGLASNTVDDVVSLSNNVITVKGVSASFVGEEYVDEILKDYAKTNLFPIGTSNIQDRAITFQKLGLGAVHGSSLADKAITFGKFNDSIVDSAPSTNKNRFVTSEGIWRAFWGDSQQKPYTNNSFYSWSVDQLNLKRDYTNITYNAIVSVKKPALHAILTSRGSQLLEYYLPCTEDIPATPQINHVYTWRRDGAEFYITQGVSALTTIWTLYDSAGEQLVRTTTDNATQGYFPDLTFDTSAYSAVTSTKVNSYPDEVQDALALDSNIPAASTSLPRMDSPNGAVVGTSASYARGDHVHPTDTSRMAASATGADIAVSGTDATKINAALAGKASTADATLTERFSAWTLSGDIQAGRQYEVRFDYNYDGTILWAIYEDGASYPLSTGSDNPLSTSEDFPYGETSSEYTITATRTALAGYQLGSQTSKPLASEAEAEALRNGKQDALSAQQLANIAAVPSKADNTNVVHKTGDETIGGEKTFSSITRAPIFMATGNDGSASFYPDNIYFNANGRINYLMFPDAQQSDYTNTMYGSYDVLATRRYVQWANSGKLDKSGGTVTGALTLLDTLFLKSDPYANGIEITPYGWIGYNNLTALYLDSLILAYNSNDHCRFKMELADGTYAELANTADLLTKLDSTSASPEFVETSSYIVGQFVSHEGHIYRCKTNHPAGAWNSTHFQEVEILFNHTPHGADTNPLAIGASSSAGPNATAIGARATAGNLGIALGANDGNSSTQAGVKGVAVGCGTSTGERGIAIGDKARADKIGSIAIGGTRVSSDSAGAIANAEGACQIGYSATANDVPNSLRFRDTEVVDSNGFIRAEYSLEKNLRNIQGNVRDRVVRYQSISERLVELFVVPEAIPNKARDFYVDVENVTTEQAQIEFNGLGASWYAYVEDGNDLSDMTVLQAGEKARFHFSETGFTQGSLPVLLITKKIVKPINPDTNIWALNSDGSVTTLGDYNQDGTITIDGDLNPDGTVTVEAK